MAKVVEPSATNEGRGRVRYDHPAFGAIRASRVTGSQVLAGSDFIHHNYVMVEISRASLTRDLAHDWYHGAGEPIVRVNLSEAQWATFVSSLNMGSGTPCTLERVGREQMPDLPAPTSRTQQFTAEALAMVEQIIDRVKALEAVIADASIPAKTKSKVALELNVIRSHLEANIPYVGQAFTEHVERVTEHAKVEINAHVQTTLMRAGMQALGGGHRAPIELPEGLRDEE